MLVIDCLKSLTGLDQTKTDTANIFDESSLVLIKL